MRRIYSGFARRCPRCYLTKRWCVCAEHREVRCPLAIDVLIHHREQFRPTSTGNLIARLVPEARLHAWRADAPVQAETVRRPGRELWVLHPHGRPAPAGATPEQVQVVLLDGVWSETAIMARAVHDWGRLVSLPMSGESRYWLRAQQVGGRFSTIEALLHVLRDFGLAAAHEELRRQFELHVYASLRVRGLKERAEEFLRESPVPAAFPELLAQLNVRRPLVGPEVGSGKPADE
jgi:DTW domain-containing protein YfiP